MQDSDAENANLISDNDTGCEQEHDIEVDIEEEGELEGQFESDVDSNSAHTIDSEDSDELEVSDDSNNDLDGYVSF